MNDDLMVGGHISRQFDQELDEIRSRVLKMGGLVEAQLDKTIEALHEGDAECITDVEKLDHKVCLLYTSPSPRDATLSRMPSSA